MDDAVKQHIIEALKKGTRLDGRKLDELRPIEITTDVSSTAEGSAKIVAGETEIIVGVKMVIGKPYPDRPDSGTLMVGAELRPIANPEFEMGPPSIESIETARVIDRTIRESGTIDEKSLCIEAGEKVWMVNVDVCPLNHDGNLIDLGELAGLVALKNTKLPEIDENGDANYKKKSKKGLKLSAEPIAVTVVKIGDNLLIDPTDAEMKAADARLTVGVLKDNSLCSMQKGGDKALTAEEIDAMLEMAVKTAGKLRKLL
jgi:exosome complex component RRP42